MTLFYWHWNNPNNRPFWGGPHDPCVWMLMKSTGPACSRASALEEKLPAARGTNLLQAATTSSKGQEARSKKSGIRKQNQEAITSSKGQVLGAWVSSLELVSCGFRKERHGQLQAAGAIRPSLPRCFSVARSVLGAWASSLELISCGFRKERCGQLQAAGAIRPSLPQCFSVARSVLGAWASSLELIS